MFSPISIKVEIKESMRVKKTSELLTEKKAEIKPKEQQIDIKSYNGLSIFQGLAKNALKTANSIIKTFENNATKEFTLKNQNK